MQPRATINLAKASRLIDDKTSLVADPNISATKDKKRRKSAFAEEDEGYQFVEEGFRLRFSNGETIDFYADSTAQKDEWMVALSQAVGAKVSSSTGTKVAKWTELVLSHEDSLLSKAKKEKKSVMPEINVLPPSSSKNLNSSSPILAGMGQAGQWTRSAPNSPVKRDSVVRKEVGRGPEVPPKNTDEGAWMAGGNGRRAGTPPPASAAKRGERRKAVQSMIL